MNNNINTSAAPAGLEVPAFRPVQAVDPKPRPENVKPAEIEAKSEPKRDAQETRRQLLEASEQLNRQMANSKRDLSFSVDDVANKIVLTVKNSQNGEVVRQIPSEAALKVAHNLANIKGLLQDEKI